MQTEVTGREPLMSVGELASRLGVSTDTIYRKLSKPGFLPPHVKVVSQYRWVPSTVESWIQAQETIAS